MYSGDVRAMWGWGTMRVGGIGDLRGLGDAGSPGATGGVFSACDAKGLNASASRCCGCEFWATDGENRWLKLLKSFKGFESSQKS